MSPLHRIATEEAFSIAEVAAAPRQVVPAR